MASLYYEPVVCPVVIGRDRYLAILDRLIEQAQGGRGQIALVAGEAGLGKSRLLAEAMVRAERRGLRLLKGNCFESDHVLPYAPLLDLLRTAFAVQPSDRLVPYLAAQAGELVRILPELARWIPEISPTPALDPEGEKRRIFHALAQFLTALTGHQPTLLIIEDLHWADDTSLEFLLHLSRSLPIGPLTIVLAYRSDEISPSLGHLLAEFDRERRAVELRLVPLTIVEVDAMLRAIFDLQRPIRPDFLGSLYALAEGNPFFVEEVVNALIIPGEQSGKIIAPDHTSLQGVPIPRTIQEAVQRRSRQLSPVAHHVLALAAVAGRRFDFDLLQSVLHLGEQELLQCVKEFIAAQLVIELSAEEFAFRHALTQQTVYDSLLARERRSLHRIIGDTLERRYGAAGDAPAAELSRHFYEAGVWAKARDYAERAGERAQALYASRTAVDLFSRAIEATRNLSLLPTPAICQARGRAYETLGDFDRAQADYEMARDRARALADRRAEWQALLALGFLWAARDYTRTGDFLRQALVLTRELGHPELVASSLNRLGNWHMNIEQPAEALGFHEEALAIFRSINDAAGLAETLDFLTTTTLTIGDLVRGTAYSEQAVSLLHNLGHWQGLSSCLAVRVFCGETYLSNTLRPTMRFLDALGEGELALKTAREIGWRSGEAFALMALGHSLGAHGEYARALQVAQESLAIAEEIEHRQWRTAAHCLLGALYLDLLAPVVARQHLERALALAREIGSLIWVWYATGYLALVYIMERDLRHASAVLDAAFDPTAPMQTLGQRLCWCARAELALAQGSPDRALHIIDQLANTSLQEAGVYEVPRLGKVRGEALLMLHRGEEAEATLLAARETARAWEVRPQLWRTQIALGKCYRMNVHHQVAEQLFSDAQAAIAACAVGLPDATLREDFLRQATGLIPRRRAVSPRLAIKRAAGGLTARECEVAVLIARGLTNRQIATQFVIAEETAAVHIKHILGKLGFVSRAQIAAWVVQQHFFVAGSEAPPA